MNVTLTACQEKGLDKAAFMNLKLLGRDTGGVIVQGAIVRAMEELE